jgi:hypothetical protein
LDATFGEQFLYVAKAQGEAQVEPYRMGDDLAREPVPAVRIPVTSNGRARFRRHDRKPTARLPT